MTKNEKNIIEGTKEFAKAHNIHYDQMTENMILNALREQLTLSSVVKRLWVKFTIIIAYLPMLLIDYLISLTTDESYKEARKTTMRSFKRVWHN